MAHRIVMARAIQRGWQGYLGDVVAAFLQADLGEDVEVFVVPPDSETQGKKFLWRCRKALYGLRGSPRDFNRFFTKVALQQGWQRVRGEPQLFCHQRFKGALMSVHTDDVLFTCHPKHEKAIKQQLSEVLRIRWEEAFSTEWRKFLGVEWRI